MPKINKLGVIGSPIDHSLSPFIHSRFARQANLNIDYRPYKVESDELDMFLKDFFADKNAIGLNVTLPLKKEAFLPWLKNIISITPKKTLFATSITVGIAEETRP